MVFSESAIKLRFKDTLTNGFNKIKFLILYMYDNLSGNYFLFVTLIK